MEIDLDLATDRVRRRARFAYELGRVRAGLLRGAGLALAAGAVAWFAVGGQAPAWVPLTFVVAAICEWRGGLLASGARRGLVAGLVTLFLPLALLRPCCGTDVPGPSGACCTMPSACLLAGALFGLSLSLFLPASSRGNDGLARGLEATAGMALGASSIAAMRCAGLFAGEALGLVGGLVAGVAAAGLARALLDRRRASIA